MRCGSEGRGSMDKSKHLRTGSGEQALHLQTIGLAVATVVIPVKRKVFRAVTVVNGAIVGKIGLWSTV